jgi:hypothetical protein
MPTPTVIAAVEKAPSKGPATEPTPTPDTQREALTEKARQYYEKNPLIVNGSQLNGILVSERTPEGKILISIRTFTGTMEVAVLAGQWGYFALDEKNEVTGIVWAKADTFTDSQGKKGYLGDSEIATAGAGFFGAKQVGYWTKDGQLIATLDPKTGEAKEIAIIPEFKGLTLEGFTQKYDLEKKVWTYLDTDGQTIAFWDEKGNEGKGRIELAQGIKGLDFEKHRSLFIGRDIKESEAAFLEAQKNGEVKIPIPFKIENGEVLVKKSLKWILAFRNIPPGTVLYMPFGGLIGLGGLGDAKGNISEQYVNIWRIRDEFGLQVIYPLSYEYLGPKGGGEMTAGSSFLKTNQEVFSDLGFGVFRGDSICIGPRGNTLANSIGLTLNNIQKDSLGRLIYLR